MCTRIHQNRVWASKTFQILIVPHSSRHCCHVVLPFSPIFFRAVYSPDRSIHPPIYPSIQEFCISSQSFFALSWLLVPSAGSQLFGEPRRSVLAFTSGCTKRPQTVHLKVRCSWSLSWSLTPRLLTMAHGCKGYLTFCNSSLSQEGRGCPRRCSSFDSSTLCSL